MIKKDEDFGTYKLHTYETDTFKTTLINVVFRNNFIFEEYEKRCLLVDYLAYVTNDYPTNRDLRLKLEDLYGAKLSGGINRCGKTILTNFAISVLDERYSSKENVKEAIKLIMGMIFKPLVKNKELDKKVFELVKSLYIKNLEMEKEDPEGTSIKNALKYTNNEYIGYNSVDHIEEIKLITREEVYETYLNMLKEDYVDIYVIGDMYHDLISDYIKEYSNFKIIKNHEVNYLIETKKNKCICGSGVFNAPQSNICALLYIDNITEYERSYLGIIYNCILGSASSSKLFKKVREEKGLCYNIYSSYMKTSGIYIITTGTKIGSEEEVIDYIKNIIKEKVSEEELKLAKELTYNALNTIKDSSGRIIDNAIFEDLGVLESIDERIKKYNNITVEEMNEFIKKISLYVIYTLKGETNE